MHTHAHTRKHAHTCAGTHTHTRKHAHTCKHAHTHTRKHAHTHANLEKMYAIVKTFVSRKICFFQNMYV